MAARRGKPPVPRLRAGRAGGRGEGVRLPDALNRSAFAPTRPWRRRPKERPARAQVGKTTLALTVGETRPSIYLDLESYADRARLTEPELYLADHDDKLVILDEVHRLPGLFQSLRGLIDRGRRTGKKSGRFLLLGSASIDLLKPSGEPLAGRIAYLEMHPVDALEVPADHITDLWVRGGFPDSFLAANDRASQRWRQDFIRHQACDDLEPERRMVVYPESFPLGNDIEVLSLTMAGWSLLEQR